MLCIGFGLEADKILATNLKTFSKIYRSIKRIETHRMLDISACLRLSANADEKDYLTYVSGVSKWLHLVEQRVHTKPSTKAALGASDFMKDFKDQIK